MRFVPVLLLTITACGDTNAPAPKPPTVEASIRSWRPVVGGCALDWRLSASDSSITVAYTIGESDGSGDFYTQSPHRFDGHFVSESSFTDVWTGVWADPTHVFARLAVIDHPNWGSVWGRAIRLRRSDGVGSNGMPDCWIQ